MDMFPLWLSLRVALVATALTLVIGIPVALLLARRRFPGKNVLEAAVVLPLVLPPTVLGYYLLLVIGSRGPVGRALRVVGLLERDPAAGRARGPRRRRAGFLPRPRGVRDHVEGGGEHPGPDT